MFHNWDVSCRPAGVTHQEFGALFGSHLRARPGASAGPPYFF
jgi:hypothetical protein